MQSNKKEKTLSRLNYFFINTIIDGLKEEVEASKKRDKEFFEWASKELDRQKQELKEIEKELREA